MCIYIYIYLYIYIRICIYELRIYICVYIYNCIHRYTYKTCVYFIYYYLCTGVFKDRVFLSLVEKTSMFIVKTNLLGYSPSTHPTTQRAMGSFPECVIHSPSLGVMEACSGPLVTIMKHHKSIEMVCHSIVKTIIY